MLFLVVFIINIPNVLASLAEYRESLIPFKEAYNTFLNFIFCNEDILSSDNTVLKDEQVAEINHKNFYDKIAKVFNILNYVYEEKRLTKNLAIVKVSMIYYLELIVKEHRFIPFLQIQNDQNNIDKILTLLEKNENNNFINSGIRSFHKFRKFLNNHFSENDSAKDKDERYFLNYFLSHNFNVKMIENQKFDMKFKSKQPESSSKLSSLDKVVGSMHTFNLGDPVSATLLYAFIEHLHSKNLVELATIPELCRIAVSLNKLDPILQNFNCEKCKLGICKSCNNFVKNLAIKVFMSKVVGMCSERRVEFVKEIMETDETIESFYRILEIFDFKNFNFNSNEKYNILQAYIKNKNFDPEKESIYLICMIMFGRQIELNSKELIIFTSLFSITDDSGEKKFCNSILKLYSLNFLNYTCQPNDSLLHIVALIKIYSKCEDHVLYYLLNVIIKRISDNFSDQNCAVVLAAVLETKRKNVIHHFVSQMPTKMFTNQAMLSILVTCDDINFFAFLIKIYREKGVLSSFKEIIEFTDYFCQYNFSKIIDKNYQLTVIDICGSTLTQDQIKSFFNVFLKHKKWHFIHNIIEKIEEFEFPANFTEEMIKNVVYDVVSVNSDPHGVFSSIDKLNGSIIAGVKVYFDKRVRFYYKYIYDIISWVLDSNTSSHYVILNVVCNLYDEKIFENPIYFNSLLKAADIIMLSNKYKDIFNFVLDNFDMVHWVRILKIKYLERFYMPLDSSSARNLAQNNSRSKEVLLKYVNGIIKNLKSSGKSFKPGNETQVDKKLGLLFSTNKIESLLNIGNPFYELIDLIQKDIISDDLISEKSIFDRKLQ